MHHMQQLFPANTGPTPWLQRPVTKRFRAILIMGFLLQANGMLSLERTTCWHIACCLDSTMHLCGRTQRLRWSCRKTCASRSPKGLWGTWTFTSKSVEMKGRGDMNLNTSNYYMALAGCFFPFEPWLCMDQCMAFAGCNAGAWGSCMQPACPLDLRAPDLMHASAYAPSYSLSPQ